MKVLLVILGLTFLIAGQLQAANLAGLVCNGSLSLQNINPYSVKGAAPTAPTITNVKLVIYAAKECGMGRSRFAAFTSHGPCYEMTKADILSGDRVTPDSVLFNLDVIYTPDRSEYQIFVKRNKDALPGSFQFQLQNQFVGYGTLLHRWEMAPGAVHAIMQTQGNQTTLRISDDSNQEQTLGTLSCQKVPPTF